MMRFKIRVPPAGRELISVRAKIGKDRKSLRKIMPAIEHNLRSMGFKEFEEGKWLLRLRKMCDEKKERHRFREFVLFHLDHLLQDRILGIALAVDCEDRRLVAQILSNPKNPEGLLDPEISMMDLILGYKKYLMIWEDIPSHRHF